MTVPQDRLVQIDLSSKAPLLRVPSIPAHSPNFQLPQFPCFQFFMFLSVLSEKVLFTGRTSLPGNLAPWAQYPSPEPSLSIKASLLSLPAAFAKAPPRGQARSLIML